MGSSQPEQDDFVPESPVAVILEALSRTQFACTELTPLPSGTTNYVYRGTLKEPVAISFREKNDTIATELQNTIIVKRLEPFVRVAPALKLDPIHGQFEAYMYGALEKFHWAGEQNLASTSETHRTGSTQIDARTPHLLHTNDSKKTLVAEDFGLDVIDWKKHLLKVDSGQNTGVEVNGKHMGQWLRAYHQWTMMDSQQALRDAMRGYEEMGKFRRWIHYTGIPKWTEENGLLDEDTRIIFKQVEQLLVEEFADSQTRQVTDEWGPVHGDFWAGNILVPSSAGHPSRPAFSVIDWEFAHLGPRAFDLGHMIGDLIQQVQLGKGDCFGRTISDFLEGYGKVSHQVAFRALVHAGVQLMGWYVRGPRSGLGEEGVRRIVKLARDMICFGMKRDEQWFRENNLGDIFDQ